MEASCQPPSVPTIRWSSIDSKAQSVIMGRAPTSPLVSKAYCPRPSFRSHPQSAASAAPRGFIRSGPGVQKLTTAPVNRTASRNAPSPVRVKRYRNSMSALRPLRPQLRMLRRRGLVDALGHNRTKCGAAKASCGISSSGSARDNQHLSYPWIVSPRSSMATNSAILRALVSAFLTLPIRYRIA